MAQPIVAKFGGTSLCDAQAIRNVAQIIQENSDRRYVVVSAPGKRSAEDQKITDLLYLCHAHAQQNLSFGEIFAIVADRFLQIVQDLQLQLDVRVLLEDIASMIPSSSPDYAASRGEYLTARIMASVLGWKFIDAAQLIFFDDRGSVNEEATYAAVSSRLNIDERAVIPGFYGALANGEVKTFSRGGSDVTGALVAAGVNAATYENWTDVSGFLAADPGIVVSPQQLTTLTFRELRELAYMGARVFHDEAILPARKADIPINIRNTKEPAHPGTLIVADTKAHGLSGMVTAIAGRKNFTVLTIERALMNQEIGYARKILTVLEANGISFEHMPSGIDTVSFVISDEQLGNKREDVEREIWDTCRPDTLEWCSNIALFAVVGRGMVHTPGISGKLFRALGDAKINVRMIDQGSSELSIIVGVANADLELAIRAAYRTFFS